MPLSDREMARVLAKSTQDLIRQNTTSPTDRQDALEGAIQFYTEAITQAGKRGDVPRTQQCLQKLIELRARQMKERLEREDRTSEVDKKTRMEEEVTNYSDDCLQLARAADALLARSL